MLTWGNIFFVSSYCILFRSCIFSSNSLSLPFSLLESMPFCQTFLEQLYLINEVKIFNEVSKACLWTCFHDSVFFFFPSFFFFQILSGLCGCSYFIKIYRIGPCFHNSVLIFRYWIYCGVLFLFSWSVLVLVLHEKVVLVFCT